MQAIAETAQPFNDSHWYWTDDNAKALELLALPAVRNAEPALADSVLDFVLAMSPGEAIWRRLAAPQLQARRLDPKDFLVVIPFHSFEGDLSHGLLRQSVRFNDGRERVAAVYRPSGGFPPRRPQALHRRRGQHHRLRPPPHRRRHHAVPRKHHRGAGQPAEPPRPTGGDAALQLRDPRRQRGHPAAGDAPGGARHRVVAAPPDHRLRRAFRHPSHLPCRRRWDLRRRSCRPPARPICIVDRWTTSCSRKRATPASPIRCTCGHGSQTMSPASAPPRGRMAGCNGSCCATRRPRYRRAASSPSPRRGCCLPAATWRRRRWSEPCSTCRRHWPASTRAPATTMAPS